IQQAMGDMTRVLEETIGGHKLVKVFGGQRYEQQRFQLSSNEVRHFEVKTKVLSGLSVLFVQILTAAALGIIIYIATLESAAHQITVGGFVSLFTAMGLLLSPMRRLTQVNDKLQQGLSAAESVFTLIDQPSERDHGRHPVKTRFSGKITFHQLTFSYEEHATPALSQLSLTIMPGETIAFVGASGSGKSTLTHLIPHFYPIEQGAILIDDININELPLSRLRANIALVSQDVVLFNDTVAANIAYGEMAGSSRQQVIAATQSAYALEFIEQMSEGLETQIGEKGVKLSGGQRQRLAIARALLKDAPIIIFDEATSALDTQSEFKVQQSLEKLKKGRTTLIIAHRLSTIAQADRIVVMDKGRFVEIGTHAQLMHQAGLYATLYNLEG
ncbi:MAG: ATP-binding cassette domain-containing protein, partial [Thiomargarita sp.]|nr:ATP-binding cassette domain-containing protein [Thiomargarita sp.]